MATNTQNIIEAQIETVRNRLETIFETSSQIASLVKKSPEVQQISNKLWRIPLKQYQGGSYGKFSGEGGSLGKGTSQKITKLQAGYFNVRNGWRLTKDMIDTSKNSNQSVVNIFQDALANAIIEAQVMDDIALHTDGTAKLTNQSSGSAASSLTFAGATDKLGIKRLREGMDVDVWNSGGTTKRATGSGDTAKILTIDYDTKTVTFDTTITGIATTDILAFANADAYGPAALTQGSSTWPDNTGANGLGGDSFIHGFPYANDTTGATFYLGIQRSTLPQIAPSKITANAQISFSHGLALLDKIRQRRTNDEVFNDLVWIASFSTRASVFQAGTTIAEVPVNAGRFGQSPDLMPENQKYMDTFQYCGHTAYVSKRQALDRMDAICPSKWARAQLHDMKFHDNPAGGTLFTGRASDGTVAAFVEFFTVQAYDFVCVDPGCQGFIESIDNDPLYS